MKASPRRQARNRSRSGVAAIEFVIIFPVLMLLFFGMVNVANYISAARKITQAASLVSDLVARSEDVIRNADFTDNFIAVQMAVTPLAMSNIRIDIYDYYVGSTGPALRWRKSSPGGRDCSTPDPKKAPVNTLLTSRNDVIVAVVCMPYEPPVAEFPGLSQLFRNVTIERSMTLRPWQSSTITCPATDCP